ncbi:MAG: cold shock domain-containing protein, partial [Anaerolineales bacterium]|nr:cold shock domain-containing protein [Anaerolineales bacterium]
VFAHYIAILGDSFRNLNEGQQVEFVLTLGGKGPQAQDFCGFLKQSPVIES